MLYKHKQINSKGNILIYYSILKINRLTQSAESKNMKLITQIPREYEYIHRVGKSMGN